MTCRNGHPREHATYNTAAGKLVCRDCRIEAQRKMRERRLRGELPEPQIRVARVLPIIDAALTGRRVNDVLGDTLARRVSAWRANPQSCGGLYTVDRILVKLGRIDAWYGELADLYHANPEAA